MPGALGRPHELPAPNVTAEAAGPIIRAEGVSRRFNGHTAVRDLSFSVAEGTILGLIGPSGSGKTTTVRMLAGTLARTSGDLAVMGEDPMRFSRRARNRLAYMPQLTSLSPDLSARENVGFTAALYGVGPFRRGRAIRRALEVVGLWDVRRRLARDLSGGMQRRLELACALVHDPRVLFIDEPTAGIDPILRQAIWKELRRLREAGCTMLVTTQQVAEAEECDAIALITDGELVAVSDPGEMRRMAFGGEMLELETRRAIDAEVLGGVAGVLNVRQPAPRRLLIVSDDAAATTPRIVDALNRQSVDVLRLAEYRPSFDETFEVLVERRRMERRMSDESAAA
jgi:ABC-2 type transport system ATP-binding protein